MALENPDAESDWTICYRKIGQLTRQLSGKDAVFFFLRIRERNSYNQLQLMKLRILP